MKTALILGASGQDGLLLASLLKTKSYRVVGLSRTRGNPHCDEFVRGDVADRSLVERVVAQQKPEELYYLAAYNFSSQETDFARLNDGARTTFTVNLDAYLAALQAVEQHAPRCRVFYACSSLIFGDPVESPQTESTPPRPQCLYSIAKLAGRQVSEYYRAARGLHVSVGILYNHESEHRGDAFLSKRIVNGAKAVAAGSAELVLGSLQAQCDWGYAGDFVEAMWLMVQQPQSDTYVVATGRLHRVADWVDECFRLVQLEPGRFVREDPRLLTRARPVLCGDSTKLRRVTGWSPKNSFAEMVGRIYRGAA